MDECLQNTIDSGLRDLGLAMDSLQRHRLILSLQEFEDIECLRQDGDEI
jgi:hypothetical protein